METQIIAAFILYLIILLAIGIFAHKKSTTEVDFIMGNRSLNFWLVALSAHASDMSAWLFMAFPAAVFIGGLSQVWIALGLLLGMLANWHFVASKLRIATEEMDSYTLSTFFERRFNDRSGILRSLTALMSIVFFASYLSGGLIAMGYLFESLFGIDYYVGITIATCVVVFYTIIGGFVTVAWADLFQGIFLLLMILLVPAVAFTKISGIQAIVQSAQAKEISLSVLKDPSITSMISVLLLAAGWGLGYFGQPHIVTKFMGIRQASDLRKSKYLGMAWQLLTLAAAATVGLIGIAYFSQGLANSEMVFVEMVKGLFPPFIVGFILCGVIAANMSTMDSQILVCASVITEDVYKHFIHKKASSRQLLKVSRIGVVVISFFALFLAYSKSSTVADTVFYAWTGLGCSFGPLVLVSLYSKNANRYGAIAGIFVGGVLAATWRYLNPLIIDFSIPSMVPGFLLSLLTILGVSWLTGSQKRQLQD